MSKLLSPFSYKYFRSGSAWIILLIGILLYALGYFGINADSIWKEIVIKIGDVLVIGVILGYLSNAAQFLGIFKQDLQDIIYGKEFISQRKDITPLWETVSKQMFRNKFPTLHKDLLNVVNGYFPKDEVSFYNDYEVNASIEWVNREQGIIKVTDTTTFELIAESKEQFTYPLVTWTKVADNGVYEEKILEFSINQVKPQIESEREFKDGDNICKERKILLHGYTKYEVRYVREKIYDINVDYYIGFRAKYIVNHLRVCLDYPEGIDATFIFRGTQHDFEDIRHGMSNRIEKKYKGIILPRQGYIFALQKGQ
ncbi:MAG: hypothetical protein IJQ59_07125 [Bacteroidaceae bacterium]|nr:hypothetical protein [Bacteroidaceae bacterium]